MGWNVLEATGTQRCTRSLKDSLGNEDDDVKEAVVSLEVLQALKGESGWEGRSPEGLRLACSSPAPFLALLQADPQR